MEKNGPSRNLLSGSKMFVRCCSDPVGHYNLSSYFLVTTSLKYTVLAARSLANHQILNLFKLKSRHKRCLPKPVQSYFVRILGKKVSPRFRRKKETKPGTVAVDNINSRMKITACISDRALIIPERLPFRNSDEIKSRPKYRPGTPAGLC
ncbi:hypothetical protein J6590_003827 [Homalodisca vitripennis]|nr:hypothetical protein J6590_003827 [Homalodisca vitripennis]